MKGPKPPRRHAGTLEWTQSLPWHTGTCIGGWGVGKPLSLALLAAHQKSPERRKGSGEVL